VPTLIVLGEKDARISTLLAGSFMKELQVASGHNQRRWALRAHGKTD